MYDSGPYRAAHLPGANCQVPKVLYPHLHNTLTPGELAEEHVDTVAPLAEASASPTMRVARLPPVGGRVFYDAPDQLRSSFGQPVVEVYYDQARGAVNKLRKYRKFVEVG